MLTWLRVTLIVLSVLSTASAAAASAAIVLRIQTPDVIGDSAIPGHVGEVAATTFSFVKFPGSNPCGPARLSKDVDRASPTLFLDSLRGRVYQTVRVFFLDTTAARTPVAILTIALDEVTITDYSLSEAAASGKASPRPTEELTLSFSEMRFANEVTGETVGWDCKTNKQI